MPPDDLEGFGQAVGGDGGAEDVVPVDDLLEGGEEGVELVAAGEAEHGGEHVGVAVVVAGDDVVEVDAFLERGQRLLKG